MRQLIIARKDLNMSPGKFAAQVSHASMAFLSQMLLNGDKKTEINETYTITFNIPVNIYEEWFCGIFTKTICEAKNRNQLLKAVSIAKDLGLKENEDYFFIKDNCLTELEPEELDENGVGRTLTCIGFKPLPDNVAHAISKKYQLYK